MRDGAAVPVTRPFVDRPITDVAAADMLAQEASAAWGLDRPELLRRGMNCIYTTGDVVIRVSAPTAQPTAAIDLADALLALGFPVGVPAAPDAVANGDLAATCWERIVEIDRPVDWATVGSIIRRVHELDSAVLPPAYPRPSPACFPWWRFAALLDETRDLIDARALSGLERTIDRWDGWQTFDESTVCHGDVHPGNVMMTADGPVLIDWDLMCTAPVAWDHGPLMTWQERWGGDPGTYESFAEGYGASMRGDPAAQVFAELRLVAATLMRVRAGRLDTSARAEAERRLAYWRGDRDAPAWTAQ